MKKLLFLSVIILSFFACNSDKPADSSSVSTVERSSEITVGQDFIEYGNLRLYPVTASNAFLEENAAAAEVAVLKHALKSPKFRISEHKPFGRFEDAMAVNNLTVENKLHQDVLLMSGDVIQGGKQDRTIADDRIIAANSIKNIPVFCVEAGRWDYQEGTEAENGSEDRIMAFNGYYNLASNDLRKTIKKGSQQEVWDKVAEVTSSQEVESFSNAYAGLESSESFTQNRDQYLGQFKAGFNEDNVVGIIAISGNQILGTDIFGHSELFQKAYEALLHSYITDALTFGSEITIDEDTVLNHGKTLPRKVSGTNSFKHKGAIIHFSDL
jgi:hypothetical protein